MTQDPRAYALEVAREVTGLLSVMLGATKPGDKAASAAAEKLAHYLSDDYKDTNDIVGRKISEVVRQTKERLPTEQAARFADMIDVALARIDIKASIHYWLKDEDGKALTLSSLQGMELDFIRYTHEEVLIPIIFAPMGTGKSTLLVGQKAYEIGRNVNVMEQLICSSDSMASKRGMAIRNILESPHYKKIFPHLQKREPWTNHELMIARSKADRAAEVTRESKGDSGSIDPTLACYGITSSALGTRSHFSDFDDIATEENSVFQPAEGRRIYSLLTTKWFTRKKSPVGMSDADYDYKNNPWRGRIIGTPWAYDDPIYSLRDYPGAAVILIGVNDTVTAYNVQIWGLPDKYIERLRRRYGTGTVDFRKELPDDIKKWCEREGLPTDRHYTLGEGKIRDQITPPKSTMEVPLSRPREWYLRELKNCKDPKSEFDRPYRCEVFSEGELAYPGFASSLFTSYPGWGDRKIEVPKEPVRLVRKGTQAEIVGWRSYMDSPPPDGAHKITMVDLSGMNRQGTVLTTAVLTPEHRRRVVEVVTGAFAPEEISGQVGDVFDRHKDLLVCYVESVSLQSIFVGEMTKHRKEYPWWSKVQPFGDTTTKKNDKQIGILTMGLSFAKGGFELPNTWHDDYKSDGHGRKCQCGYCRIILDASTQTRLAPVKSDVLITLWGIHINMPHALDMGGDPIAPGGRNYAANGYELMKPPELGAVGSYIFGADQHGRVIKKKNGVAPKGKGRRPESPVNRLQALTGLIPRPNDDDRWR